MTDMTPRQILDAIDRALDKAAHVAASKRGNGSPERIDRPVKPMEQMTPREILAALDRALDKAARSVARPHAERSPYD